MDEQKFLRLLATTLAVIGSIGLAISLGVHVNIWVGWFALVACWLPTSWHLWSAERSRREFSQPLASVEHYIAREDEQV